MIKFSIMQFILFIYLVSSFVAVQSSDPRSESAAAGGEAVQQGYAPETGRPYSSHPRAVQSDRSDRQNEGRFPSDEGRGRAHQAGTRTAADQSAGICPGLEQVSVFRVYRDGIRLI